MAVDPISLEVFKNMFISVAEEMGVALLRTAYSPNIKERRDFSCAIFDPQGQLVAQAAHQPVHLGAMPASVQAALDAFPNGVRPGDAIIFNDPYLGSTHLPDIALVAPVYVDQKGVNQMAGFVSNRGHHADVGGMPPGSLPLSTELYQEGLILPPIKLARGGRLNREIIQLTCRNSRTPEERKGDLAAQIASIRVGERRLQEVVRRYGIAEALEHMEALLYYSERMIRFAIQQIRDGAYRAVDYMDDDGLTKQPVPIAVAITVSACLYMVRCVVGDQAPANRISASVYSRLWSLRLSSTLTAAWRWRREYHQASTGRRRGHPPKGLQPSETGLPIGATSYPSSVSMRRRKAGRRSRSRSA